MLTNRSAPHPATIKTPIGGTTRLLVNRASVECRSRRVHFFVPRIVMRTTSRAGTASDMVEATGSIRDLFRILEVLVLTCSSCSER